MSKLLVAFVSMTFFMVSPSWAGELESILDKHLEARGGQEALSAVQSMRVVGELTLDEQKTAYRVEWKSPDKIRLEYDLGGATSVEAFDGKAAWAISPFSGDPSPLPLSGQRARRAQERADYLEGPLIHAERKGHRIELLGKARKGGVEAYKLAIHHANGALIHVYLDAGNFLMIRQERDVTIGHRTLPQVSRYSQYRRVGDLWMAHRIDVKIGRGKEDMHGAHGGTQSVEIHHVELNGDVDADRFQLR